MRGGSRFFALGAAMLAAALGQQSTQQTTTFIIDPNGRRVEAASYAERSSPTGSQKVETTRSINGRRVPLESAEDKVLSDDGRGNRTVERVVRRFDANGNPGPAERVRIEQRVNPDGSKTVLNSVYREDLNGRPQLQERSVTEIREQGDRTQSVTTVQRGTLNGGLELVEKTSRLERKTQSGAEVEATTYQRDLNGNLNVFSTQSMVKTERGNQETTDSTIYIAGPDGKLQLSTRTVGTVTKKSDGSLVEEVDVYGRGVGYAADANAPAPRLQQQVLRERTVAADGTISEVTSVRQRMPNDSSRFGNFERVAETTIVSTDAEGRQVKKAASEVSRRSPSGELKPAEAAVSTTITLPKR
jgi:hypothetical protein